MKYLGIVLIVFSILSCHSGEASSAAYEAKESALTTSNESDDYDGYADLEEQEEQSSVVVERKIIKTASIRFQVENLDKSTQRIEALTKEYAGLIASMNQRNSNYSINNNLTIRIPSDKLDLFITAIKAESIHIDYTKINSQDVTEEFVDITGRLANKKEVRDRYVEILRKKAKTVKDILEAEEKIRVIQEEIESIEGRLKYLKNKTALSTINIEIYQEVEYVKSPKVYKKSFFVKLKEGFVNGWELIQDMTLGLVAIWPIIVLLLLLFFFRRRLRTLVKR